MLNLDVDSNQALTWVGCSLKPGDDSSPVQILLTSADSPRQRVRLDCDGPQYIELLDNSVNPQAEFFSSMTQTLVDCIEAMILVCMLFWVGFAADEWTTAKEEIDSLKSETRARALGAWPVGKF